MARAKKHVGPDGVEYVEFKCPGCGHECVPVTGPKAWGFNGSLDRPTFTPSILIRRKDWDYDAPTDAAREASIRDVVCHSFVTDGRIQFLGDCTHELAGQTVDLPEIES